MAKAFKLIAYELSMCEALSGHTAHHEKAQCTRTRLYYDAVDMRNFANG
jgi:hypothetical protein